ncbi:hydrolase [Weissella viridescens]|jgi:uncharacterized protein|uniref:HD superfamily hydrolase n=1 Tax=Weissella viridescens TaxID=1629 RepID=A0A0R2H1N5_WEIVI|nr:HD domain-containing protein [Weissella viridescens]KRN46536.1 HD superfamily hydrolase [Weissella viridescens]MBX4172932.1 HD domain-containing protein [Weissella viridescens]MCB6840566.1 HD domain-containing protein [Weissella viridescens]MCB6847326.1 HD domain-containing protein [Weissella viridescens]WJI91445.1 HD domain-containing protein [Weissella viridescens]
MKDWREDEAYVDIVSDLLRTPEVQKLGDYVQHHHSDRLTHSINVSYQSYRLAKRWHLDARAVARAGLLHDMFFYDWRTTKFELGTHAYIHPRVSLRNAEKITDLSPKEKDIILKHMWGSTSALPHYRESILVDMVDNWAAVQEFFTPATERFKKLTHRKTKAN